MLVRIANREDTDLIWDYTLCLGHFGRQLVFQNLRKIILSTRFLKSYLMFWFWFVALCPSQQRWSCRDGQFTRPHFFLGKLDQAVNQYFVHILSHVTDNKVRQRAKIKNQYNQTPHLTQDTNGKVTTSQLDIINESQEVSPFPSGDHKASINRRAQKHNKYKTEIT